MKTKLNYKKGFRFRGLRRNKALRLVFSALALGLLIGVVAILKTPSVVHADTAGPCVIPTTNYGTDTMTITAPATGTLYIWSRIQSPTATNNQFMLQVNDTSVSPNTSLCYSDVSSTSIPANTWTWTDSNNTATIVNATAGDKLQLEYVGLQTGVALDEVLITSDSTCTPQNASGSPCTSISNGVNLPFYLKAGTNTNYQDPSTGITWNADQPSSNPYVIQDNTYGSTGGLSQGGDGSSCTTPIANSNCTTHAIAGTSDPGVYQSERWGDFHYDIPIAAGTYAVTLKFAEINPNSGARSFNIAVEGNQVQSAFTPSPSYTADDLTFQATVPSSGTYVNDLNIAFTTVSNSATLSGIVVTSTASPTISVTSPTGGTTVSGTVPLSAIVGNTSGTTTVSYAIDGNTIGSSTTSPSYTVNWNSTTVADGPHVLIATVTSNGQTATNQINFSTNNNGCSTSPPAPTNLTVGTVTASNVMLSWTAPTAATGCTITGYNVYRGTNSVNPLPLLVSVGPTTSESDGSVSASTTYYYVVKAVYASTTSASGVDSPASNQVSATTKSNCANGSGAPTAPGTPTIVSSATSYTQIGFTWTASTDNNGCTLSGYYVYRNGVLITPNLVTGNSYTDTGPLQSGTSYAYYVMADDSGSNKTISPTANLSTTKDTTAPTIPTGVAGTSTSNSVALTWNPSSDLPNPGGVGVAGYNVYVGSSLVPVNGTLISGTSYTVPNLSPSTNYQFSVQAVDNNSNADAIASLTPITVVTKAATCSGTPSVPTNLTSPSQTLNSITISWSASTAPAGCTLQGYQVYRNSVAVGSIIPGTTYTDPNLSPNTSYSYSVAAVDSNGPASNPSSNQTFMTQADTTPPSTPTNFTATANSATQVQLTWTASSDNVAVSSYTITRAGGATFTPVTVSGGNTTNYVDSTVAASTTYTYTIKAVDSSGNSSTNPATVQVITPPGVVTQRPPTPTGLQSILITANFVDITWNPSAGATSYTVYRNGQAIATITATEYGDSNLNDNTTYTYTVLASNSAGSSNQTNGLSVQTLISPTTSLIGDITGPLGKPDGKVNVFDLAILLANYNQANMTYSQGDLDNNTVVNVTDLGIMLSNWTG